MSIKVPRFISVLFLFLFAAGSSAPQLYAQDNSAQASVEAFLQAIRSADFPATDAAQSKRVAEANSYLDLQAMGKKALGSHWGAMSESEQKRFMELFWKLIENIAYPRTKKFLGDQKITYPEIKPLEKGVLVSSMVKDPETELDVPVVYHVYQEGPSWKIDDILMDDVSLTEDLQYQFEKLLEGGSAEVLLQRMAERLAEVQKEAAGA